MDQFEYVMVLISIIIGLASRTSSLVVGVPIRKSQFKVSQFLGCSGHGVAILVRFWCAPGNGCLIEAMFEIVTHFPGRIERIAPVLG